MAEAGAGATSTLKGKPKRHGFVKLKSFLDKDGALVLQMVEARDLKPPNKGTTASPYVKMYIQPDKAKKTKQKSSVRKGTLNPVWEEEFRWPLEAGADHSDKVLEITLWDKDAQTKYDFLGRTAIKLTEILPPKPPLDGWLELFDGEKGREEFRVVEPTGDAAKHQVVLYDYNPRCAQELLIRVDDIVNILSEEKDWVLAENAITGGQGYIPHGFTAPMNSLESEPWYFGPIPRAKAEKLLLNPMRKHGAFLIRESESTPGSYSLSMRDGDSVRHFRIQSVAGDKYRIQGSPSPPFDTLADLVAYHREKKSGLTTTLKEACPQESKGGATDLAYEVKDKWEVPRESIELIGVLGQGQYGEVYRGTWNGTTEVAVKTLKEDTSCAEDFLAEAAIMKELKHPNLIQLYAVCTIGKPIFIITELVPKGCLLDYLQSPAGQELRLPTLIDMATDVASGMAYLEAKNFVHRDLAARNVLVGAENNCKVADFGLARLVKGEAFKADNLQKFPVRWTAPEAMAQNRYSIKSDVWSFGILMTELVTYGRKPYHGMTNREVVQKVEEGFRMPQPAGCPEGVYAIMLECWRASPADRPTFESLVFRLDDFFHSTEANYTDVRKMMEEDGEKKPGEGDAPAAAT